MGCRGFPSGTMYQRRDSPLERHSFNELVSQQVCLSIQQSLIFLRYGDDGSWSAISIRVGTPPQWVDVMVNTVSSETWVVGPGGCSGNSELEPLF